MLNPQGAPIINAYRITVELIDHADQIVDLELTIPTDTPQEFPSVLTRPLSDVPPPEWQQDTWLDENSAKLMQNYAWTRERDERWFPDVTRDVPPADLSELDDDTYRWRITWWTDRAGPTEIILSIPDTDMSRP